MKHTVDYARHAAEALHAVYGGHDFSLPPKHEVTHDLDSCGGRASWERIAQELLFALPEPDEEPRNEWLDRLTKAERENRCGDAACMTRRVSAAIRVLTGGKEHQDYCWPIEAFEAELGVRDPALVGPQPSDAMLDAALHAKRHTPATD